MREPPEEGPRKGGREPENREKEQVGHRRTNELLFAGLVEMRGLCGGAGGVFPPHLCLGFLPSLAERVTVTDKRDGEIIPSN